ncbi:helix-turn-helix domain-containing protein [Mycobacterium koreense]|uniref:Helix-turn-helix domain-containing protein n=2 Tax=Mycolicibacillus koreensis TaxID=1069220 RepID=A0AA91PEH6_9MYCO|nr:helix-turn-helix domain-containing protein [Mycolicibacillus koreensis]OSC33714.1 hypothetical protein B8W67_10015 [Mycolicibacillus koreensis]
MGGEYLTPTQVTQRLNVSPQTLSYWRSRNTGPLSIKIGNGVRYPREQFEEWLAEQVSTSARGDAVARESKPTRGGSRTRSGSPFGGTSTDVTKGRRA